MNDSFLVKSMLKIKNILAKETDIGDIEMSFTLIIDNKLNAHSMHSFNSLCLAFSVGKKPAIIQCIEFFKTIAF